MHQGRTADRAAGLSVVVTVASGGAGDVPKIPVPQGFIRFEVASGCGGRLDPDRLVQFVEDVIQALEAADLQDRKSGAFE